MKRRITLVPVLMLCVLLAAGCASMSKTQKGAAIGAAAGALGGAAVSDDNTKGAVIGGAIGALAGGLIGSYMDKQAAEMEEIEGATITREGDQLKVTFDNAILFDFDSSVLKPASRTQLDQVAGVLVKYPDTDILVMGHTDSKGSEDYNLNLSERRAASVRNYLEAQGVATLRIRSRGFGESVPVSDNTSDLGRAQNRRVELSIMANEELRERAAQG